MKIPIDVELLKKWRDQLDPHMFASGEEDEYNNEGVIAVCNDLDNILHLAFFDVRNGPQGA